MDTMRIAWNRLKAKTFRQLIRLVFLRIWPLSIIFGLYYRYRYSLRRYQQVNRHAARLLIEQGIMLTDRQATIVKELREEGIVIFNINEVIPDVSVMDLATHAEDLLSNEPSRAKIKGRNNPDDAKWYVVRALAGGAQELEIPSWISQIVLHPNLLAVVNGYLGFFSRLIYVDVWYNFRVSNYEPSIDSEYWHRDHEDRHVFKLFLYLHDINEGEGPYQYLRRTHPHGEQYGLFPHSPPLGTYPPGTEVEAAIPPELHKVCTGKAGSMVLADTVGFHRGGRCTESSRTLLTATYASNLGIDPKTFHLITDAQYEALDTAGRYAIRIGVD
jgi:hypothetical protein